MIILICPLRMFWHRQSTYIKILRKENEEENMICIFKCPSCDSNMTFNVEKQKLECAVCSTEIAVDEYDAGEMTLDGGKKCADETSSYRCPTCGAEMLTETEQATCTCSYCGTGMAVFGSGEGKVSPEKIIPFSISKAQAEAFFKQWWMEHDTMPEFQMQKMKLDIRPMYLPVWLINANVRSDVSAIVKRTEIVGVKDLFGKTSELSYMMARNDAISRLSDRRKETKNYLIRKLVESKFDRVPNNASYHFSSAKFQGIEPYDYDFLEDFEPAYLSGFPAEQYSVEVRDVIPATIKRVKEFGEKQCDQFILGSGAGVSEMERKVLSQGTVELREACYALVPVWVCSYFYKKRRYSVYVNGQTGKADGQVLVGEEKTVGNFIFLLLSAFAQYFGLLFLLNVLVLRWTKVGSIDVLLTVLGGFLFLGWVIVQRAKEIFDDTSEDAEWKADIKYNQRAKTDPKRARLKKSIIGSICIVIGMFICLSSDEIFVSKILHNLPELTGLAFLPGIIWTVWFMNKRAKQSVQKEEAEYTDYLKAAQSVILGSSEQEC